MVSNEDVTQQDEMFQCIQHGFILAGNFQVFRKKNSARILLFTNPIQIYCSLFISFYTGRHHPARLLAKILMKPDLQPQLLFYPESMCLAQRSTPLLRMTYCPSMCSQFVQTTAQTNAFFSQFFYFLRQRNKLH